MNTPKNAVSEEQIPQKDNDDGYLLKIDNTTVRIRFSGEKSLNTCLADTFTRMAG